MKQYKKIVAVLTALFMIILNLPTAVLGVDAVSAYETIYAINGTVITGNANKRTDSTGGFMGNLQSSCEITYTVDFGEGGVCGFSIVNSLHPSSYSVPLTLFVKDENGNEIATIQNAPTDSWTDYRTIYAPASSDIKGVHEISITFNGNLRFFGNLKSFQFHNKERYALSTIHAQNFDEKTESISSSQSGLSNFCDDGYALYKGVIFTENPTVFLAKIKAPKTEGTLQVSTGSQAGDTIAKIPVIDTDEEYLTLYAPISENITLSGANDIYITLSGENNIELESFQFMKETVDAYSEILAYYPSATYGNITQNTSNKCLGGVNANSGAYYDAVDFGTDVPVAFQAVYSCGVGGAAGTSFEIRLDSPTSEPVVLFPVERTSGWNSEADYITRSVKITDSEKFSGIHRVYITFTRQSQANLRSFSFIGQSATSMRITAENSDTVILDTDGNEIYPELTTLHKTFKAKTVITNSSKEAEDAYLYFALMNEDNSVSTIASDVVTTEPGSNDAEITLNLSQAPKAGQYFRFYVWDSQMRPCLKEVKQLNCVDAPAYQNPLHVEAEKCTTAASGVNVKATAIGGLDNGEWVMYRSINFGTDGYKTFTAFAGAQNTGVGVVNVHIDSTSTTPIASLEIQNTGGYAVYELQYAKITEEVSGIHDVYLRFSGRAGVCDMDWFRLSDEIIPNGESQEPVLYNDDDSQVTYTGSFVAKTDENYKNGDYHVAEENGDSYTITFTGSGIDIYAPLSPDCGTATVTLDGQPAGAIYAYSDTEQINRTVFTLTGLINQTHTLKVEKTDGNKMILDAFKVYQRPIKVACVGDSITAGSGITDGLTYPVQLGQILGNGYNVQNFGYSGRTLMRAPDDKCYLDTDNFTNSKTFLPDIVIIMLGTNDSKTTNWITGVKENFVSDYLSLIDVYQNLPSEPRVYINTPPTAHSGQFLIQNSVVSGEMLDCMKQISEQSGCPLIDVNLATKNAGPFYVDGIHPNSTGAKLIAQKIANCIPCPQPEDKATVAKLKDDKSSVYTFISDDGYWNSVNYFCDEFEKYNLKGSVALIADYAKETEAECDNGTYGTWEQWKSLVATGRVDIINHSMTHPNLTQLTDSSVLDSEVNGAREKIMKRIPGQKLLGFCLPYNQTNTTVTAKVKEQHYGLRNGVGFNSIDPTENEWYNNRFQTIDENTTAETMNSWIDTAVTKGQWLIEMWHGVEEQWSPPTKATTDAHLQYASTKLDNLWSATYNEAIAYIRERQTSTLTIISENAQEIQLMLTDEMDDALFDYPLTLKVRVPYSWDNVTVTQNGKQINGKVITSAGQRTVYFDAVPDKGTIKISK